jgi:hypothetical protein
MRKLLTLSQRCDQHHANQHVQQLLGTAQQLTNEHGCLTRSLSSSTAGSGFLCACDTKGENWQGTPSDFCPLLRFMAVLCLLFSDHFTLHRYFGLDPHQVRFFQQGFLPCLTAEGKVIMGTNCKVTDTQHSQQKIFTFSLCAPQHTQHCTAASTQPAVHSHNSCPSVQRASC